ncbi:DNA-binding transcriptional regulator, MarR family [Acetitomaculum ruminis DSM 5522]|uniref:DNA-binding transcriptional regulator, MarR family n=1 Tax=Acetitomaculum ruminis DSM 5522 TaxID=1120918 RepID=A0A1I0XM22_9FIRM|nr:MarR family transcriptional regulator [Acetitomaculum ruminis]SFB01777.1 DNA-binding transcriptional regulator, MarR family [Acetitomaculum ruminis DSM 5522]
MEFDAIAMSEMITMVYKQKQRFKMEFMQKYRLSSSCYSILVLLSQSDGITQRMLCAELNIDDGMATRSIRLLMEKEYVYRQKNCNDARSFYIYLTDKGRNFVPLMIDEYSIWWKEKTNNCTEDELKNVIHVLKKISETSVQSFW